MSIQNILVPNNLNLYANTITANSANIPTQSIQNITSISPSGSNLTIIDSGPLMGYPISITIGDNTETYPIIYISSAQPNSEIQMNNTNAGSYANGLITFNNGNQVFTCGNNNSDNTGYVFTYGANDLKFGTGNSERYRIKATSGQMVGSQVPSIVFPGYIIQYWVGITTSAAGSIVYSFTPSSGSVCQINSYGQGIVTAGTLINSCLTRSVVTSFRNISGTVNMLPVSAPATIVVSSISDTGLASASVGGSVTSGQANVTINGVAGQTITFTGVSIISY